MNFKNLDRDALVRVGEIVSYLRDDHWMDKKSAAEYCSVSVRTLEGWKGLPRYKPSGKTLYRTSGLDQYVEKHRETSAEIDLEKLEDEAVAAVLKV